MQFVYAPNLVFVFACLIAVLACCATRGASIYQYVTDTPAVVVAPGASTSVHIYLQETVTPATSASMINADPGLYSVGVRADRNASSAAAISTFTLNKSQFSDAPGILNVSTSSLEVQQEVQYVTPFVGAKVVATSSGVYRVLLGDLAISGVSAGKSTFTLDQLGRPYGDDGYTLLVTNASTFSTLDLDTVSPSNTASTFNVTVATPEPTCGLGIWCVALPLLARRGLRSRQNKGLFFRRGFHA